MNSISWLQTVLRNIFGRADKAAMGSFSRRLIIGTDPIKSWLFPDGTVVKTLKKLNLIPIIVNQKLRLDFGRA